MKKHSAPGHIREQAEHRQRVEPLRREEPVVCPLCRGLGRLEQDSLLFCPKCDGEGIIYDGH